jgi:hypothetical protein
MSLFIYPQSPQNNAHGLTLRDHYAGLAMQALLSNSSLSVVGSNGLECSDWLGKASYQAADCLLEVRGHSK